MHIIPAVDIRGGKAVRLLRGEKSRETVYSNSPADMARRWAAEGATYLHVVDLDGAFDGMSENAIHIRDIVMAVDIPVEVGGGVRDLDKAKRLVDYGVERVIVGTRALLAPEFVAELAGALPGKINVGVDARDGLVAVKGWTETSGVKAVDFLAGLEALGASGAIYTDISRDGALQGANIPALRAACAATPLPVIASGGVASVEDVEALSGLPLFGIIVGKALYEGRMTLEEAMAALG
ncbi:MAG: 1-(5-phosphoribosyl)-5-[(5-phosphoribosylamino)methylideneamino]imidazole-4-carboxamide isomerase [Planctomycetota bacterium]|nr:1-(5-phosphoribosyl)-5-[(5-phosphoribosylamino)methylideneamino]imidazole-4-carboxamide isomerase [Planctomycetota bacterium]